MHDELTLCPFERRIVGGQGAVLLRRNHDHAERCREAIRRRSHPGWSAFNCGFAVTEAA